MPPRPDSFLRAPAGTGKTRTATVLTTAGLLLIASLLAACGTTGVDQHLAVDSVTHRLAMSATPSAARRSQAQSERVAAAAATRAFGAIIASSSVALVDEVERLGTALADGQIPTAKTDELTAQADFDRIRILDTGNTINMGALDGLSTGLAAGQPFGGLHAVEQDLWSSGTSGTDPGELADLSSGLVTQAQVAEFLLAKEVLDPEAIGVAGADELSWVDEMAIPGNEELYSHRDAVDIAATVDAADLAFSDIEPLCRLVAPSLTQTVAGHFAQLLAAVAALGPPDGVSDTSLLPGTRLSLSQQVDATATPLAQLAATLVPFGTSGPPS
jgi:iron uptake system EfeUOB component EfeO/EfeM